MIDLAGAVTSGRITNGHVRFLHLVRGHGRVNDYFMVRAMHRAWYARNVTIRNGGLENE